MSGGGAPRRYIYREKGRTEVNPRKYTALSQGLRESLERLDRGGAVEKLLIEVQGTAAFILAQLDSHPELKLGVRFLLHGTAKALASKRMVTGCLGRRVTPQEEQAIEECALTIARTASEIPLP